MTVCRHPVTWQRFWVLQSGHTLWWCPRCGAARDPNKGWLKPSLLHFRRIQLSEEGAPKK